MKKLLVLAILAATCAAAAAAQTSATTTTAIINGSGLGSPFNGCNGDSVTLGGSFTEATTQWGDSDGNTHTRTQIVSSALTATSSNGFSYDVIFSQKLVETVSDDDLTKSSTVTVRLKLQGPGPLNNQFFFTEMHVTFPQGGGNGPFNNKSWSKCTG